MGDLAARIHALSEHAARAALMVLADAHPDEVARVIDVLDRGQPRGDVFAAAVDEAWQASDEAATATTPPMHHSVPLPGHPVLEGAGYDCGCGACLAQPGYQRRPSVAADPGAR
jgi:hypothetical protein